MLIRWWQSVLPWTYIHTNTNMLSSMLSCEYNISHISSDISGRDNCLKQNQIEVRLLIKYTEYDYKETDIFLANDDTNDLFAYRKNRSPLNSQCVEKVTLVPKRTHDLSPDIHDINIHHLSSSCMKHLWQDSQFLSLTVFLICLLFLSLFSYTAVVLHCWIVT